MKYLFLFISAVLLLFAAVQYNDPDGLWWGIFYAIPAVWSAIVALRPELMRQMNAKVLFGLCLIATVVATVYYWPTMPHWWQSEVWWKEETAREGMGVMIVLVAMLLAFLRSVIYSINVRPRH